MRGREEQSGEGWRRKGDRKNCRLLREVEEDGGIVRVFEGRRRRRRKRRRRSVVD